MNESYDQLVQELLKSVEPGFGGAPRPEFEARILDLTRKIERAGLQNGYIREKTASVREWVSIACSARRHHRWGLERVEHFAYEDAYRLIGARPDPELDRG